MSASTDKRAPADAARRRALLTRALPLLAAAMFLVPAAPSPASAQAAASDGPDITLSDTEAGAGGDVTVRGTGWRPKAVLTVLLCGQNAIGGTNSCANADGRAVTVSPDGSFTRSLPVTDPPKACPCVVRATAVTGGYAAADARIEVAGHPVKRLPADPGGGRLSVLAARLEGSSGLLTWFGAPPERTLVLTVANLGAARARNPVFEVGTAHGLYAPEWEKQQWRGGIDPGKKKRVELPVELAAGAHGDYTVSAEYSGKVLTEQPWEVGRPWGVTLFWVLLCVVVPAAVFRLGMAIVDRTRPHRPGRAGTNAAAPVPAEDGAALPWFTPDTLAGTTDAAAPRTHR